MSLTQFNGKTALDRKRVWYGGTSVLKVGHAVCYDVDDTNAPVTGADPTYNTRGQRVVDPATANLGMFAGIVDSVPSNGQASVGATLGAGPGWIDIITPRKNDVLQVFTNISATKLSSTLGITNAGGNILVAVADATINIDLHFVAMETVDRSSTNGLVLVRAL